MMNQYLELNIFEIIVLYQEFNYNFLLRKFKSSYYYYYYYSYQVIININ